MKTTDRFKQIIKEYLDKKAATDELFAVTYKKPNKNLDECCNYILQEVQKSGCNGFEDEEIFGLAIHYYDEDSIKDVKEINARVVINHKVELTEEDKKQARKEAIEALKKEEINKAHAAAKKAEEEKKKKMQRRVEKEADIEKRQMTLF